jgi:hypothetical protein
MTCPIAVAADHQGGVGWVGAVLVNVAFFTTIAASTSATPGLLRALTAEVTNLAAAITLDSFRRARFSAIGSHVARLLATATDLLWTVVAVASAVALLTADDAPSRPSSQHEHKA